MARTSPSTTTLSILHVPECWGAPDPYILNSTAPVDAISTAIVSWCHSPVTAVDPYPTSDEKLSRLVLTLHPVGPMVDAMWLKDNDERKRTLSSAGYRTNENHLLLLVATQLLSRKASP
jgi:hypothetical protein